MAWSRDDRRWRRSTAELSGGRADGNDDGGLIWKHGRAPGVRANLGRQTEQLSAGWNGETEPELVGEEEDAAALTPGRREQKAKLMGGEARGEKN